MRCEEVMELIQRNLDGDLSASESAIMDEHLRTCHECQSLHESLSHLSLELENLPDIEPPTSIVDRILPQLEAMDQAGSINVVGMHQPKIQQGPLFWKRWALAAGGAAAVLIIWVMADNLWGPESEQSKVQMQSAADQTSNLASSPDPNQEQSAHPEVAMNRVLVEKPEQAAEKKIGLPSETETRQVVPREKQATPVPDKNEVALRPSPDSPYMKVQPEPTEQQASKQHADDQQSAGAPQEIVPLEEMLSIATILPPVQEGSPPPPVALAPQESAEMNQAMVAPELSDTKEAAARGEMTYPSPSGEWLAKLDGQTVAIIDQSGMEVFRGHLWPADREVKVEWLDEHLLQYTLFPKTTEEKSSSSEAETWIINIQDRQEQKL